MMIIIIIAIITTITVIVMINKELCKKFNLITIQTGTLTFFIGLYCYNYSLEMLNRFRTLSLLLNGFSIYVTDIIILELWNSVISLIYEHLLASYARTVSEAV